MLFQNTEGKKTSVSTFTYLICPLKYCYPKTLAINIKTGGNRRNPHTQYTQQNRIKYNYI